MSELQTEFSTSHINNDERKPQVRYRGVSGAPGKIHDFMLSVILQNTINVYLYTRKRFPEEYNFKHFCEVLSNDLYQYAHVTL
jgi:hypothetical protein